MGGKASETEPAIGFVLIHIFNPQFERPVATPAFFILMQQLDKVFLGVTPPEQRKFIIAALRHLREKGFDRMVVVAAGQFTLPKCAIEAGFPAKSIETSDISVFSSMLGCLYSGRPMGSLGFEIAESVSVGSRQEAVRECCEALDDDFKKASYLLWLIKLKQLRTHLYYERVVHDELLANRERYLAGLEDVLRKAAATYQGMSYEVADLRDVIARPHTDKTILLVNPPAYKGGYNKMFGPIEQIVRWDPGIAQFDMKEEYLRLYAQTKQYPFPTFWGKFGYSLDGLGADCVFAKRYKKDRFDFWLLTKPELLDGLDIKGTIAWTNDKELKPHKNLRIWGPDDELHPESTVRFVTVEMPQALYYRELWAHRLGVTKSERYYLILIDGKVFGTVGFHASNLLRLKSDKIEETFGFSAPSRRYPNINRLLMYLITCRDMGAVLRRDLSKANRFYTLTGLKTTCLAKYRHVKLNSGLLKLVSREKESNELYKIRYECEFRDQSFQEALRAYLEEFKAKYGASKPSEAAEGL